MGNVQMEADQIRYKDSSGTYRNVQTGLAAAIAGGGGGSSTLAGLTDTAITTPSDGQVLTYDSTAEKWENATPASGVTTLAALTDTAISTPADGQVLTYDSTTEKWENAAIPAQSIDGLSDTTITTPSDGQVLTYDATAEEWKNATPASGVTTLAALTDTDITTPSNGQVLTYDSTSSKWVNASGGSGGGGEVYPAEGTEIKIGTWAGIDLYRQLFTITSTSAQISKDITSSGIVPTNVRGLKSFAIYHTSSSTYNKAVIFNYVSGTGTSTAASNVVVSETLSGVSISGSMNISNVSEITLYVIVDYIKTP